MSEKIYITVVRSKDSDRCTVEEMYVDDICVLSVSPLSEYPEDAIIERDLISCSDIKAYMKRAYDLAKEGKELVFNYEYVENLDEFDIDKYLKSLE